jgi:predicted metal-dependent phosphoesterase TrpH
MRQFIDLHTHSTASDGTVRPEELMRRADGERLAAVALTDHDTTAGLAAARGAAAELPELRFVPGIEISAEYEPGSLHILGLGIDEHTAAARELNAWLHAVREERNRKLVARLQVLGVGIDMDDVHAAAPAAVAGQPRIIGRPHVAEALRRKGYVQTLHEAFQQHIGKGAPGFVDKRRMDPLEAVRQIRCARAAAVIAHPIQLGCDEDGLDRLVRWLADAGLDGIEAYHCDHGVRETERYLDVARRFGLMATGGSDFHGSAKPEALLGWPRVPVKTLVEPWATRWLGSA